MSVSCSLFFLPVNFSSSHGCRVLWSTLQNAFSAPFYTVWLTNSRLVGLGFLERNTVGLTVLLHTRSWSSYWSPIYVLTMWCRPEVFCINCAWVLECLSYFLSLEKLIISTVTHRIKKKKQKKKLFPFNSGREWTKLGSQSSLELWLPIILLKTVKFYI